MAAVSFVWTVVISVMRGAPAVADPPTTAAAPAPALAHMDIWTTEAAAATAHVAHVAHEASGVPKGLIPDAPQAEAPLSTAAVMAATTAAAGATAAVAAGEGAPAGAAACTAAAGS